jgi:hypothetical protein
MKGLDQDLKELFEICQTKRLDTIKRAVANSELSSEDFLKIVPKSLIRLSANLTGPGFNLLLEEVYDDSIHLLREARSLIEEHFGNLFENPAARSVLSKEREIRDKVEDSLADSSISGFNYYCIWTSSAPELTPAVRIGMKNRKGKLLLDTTTDWRELSYLLQGFTEIFVELLEKGKALAETGQIDLSDAEEVGERIGKTLESFRKIEELGPSYKIKTRTKRRKSKETSENQ